MSEDWTYHAMYHLWQHPATLVVIYDEDMPWELIP